MKQQKICSIKFDESEVIRKCIDLMNDIDSKLNRLLYRENLTKKLLAQFFVNMGFAKSISLDSDRCYQEFLIENDKYRDIFSN